MQLENKKTKIVINLEGEKLEEVSYAQLIKLFIVNSPKQGGYNWDDIENRLAITEAIKNTNGKIEMEATPFKYLKNVVEKMTWPFVHEDLMKFKEDVFSVK